MILELIRHALPRWERDPYQRKAHDAIARIYTAACATEERCDSVGECLSFFLEDPPLSLRFESPAAAALQLAVHLEKLAAELRMGVVSLNSLAPYIDQFDSSSQAVGATDVGSGQVHPGEREVPETAAGDDCPF